MLLVSMNTTVNKVKFLSPWTFNSREGRQNPNNGNVRETVGGHSLGDREGSSLKNGLQAKPGS